MQGCFRPCPKTQMLKQDASKGDARCKNVQLEKDDSRWHSVLTSENQKYVLLNKIVTVHLIRSDAYFPHSLACIPLLHSFLFVFFASPPPPPLPSPSAFPPPTCYVLVSLPTFSSPPLSLALLLSSLGLSPLPLPLPFSLLPSLPGWKILLPGHVRNGYEKERARRRSTRSTMSILLIGR